MKVLRLLLLMLMPFAGFAQQDSLSFLYTEINNLAKENSQLKEKIRKVESSATTLSSKVDKQLSGFKKENEALMAKQVENARKIANQSKAELELLRQEIKTQNAELLELSIKVDSKYKSLMMIMIVGLILLPVITVIVARSAIKKAIMSNSGNWNEFQEHILRQK